MKYKHFSISPTTFIKLATLIALTIAYLCSGCEVFKTFKENKIDTASVKRSIVAVDNITEAAAIRTENNISHEENEWFRLTMKYLSEKKDVDTTINNFITQPATLIYEGGHSSRDEESKVIDSTWYHTIMKMLALSVDSISRKVDHYEKTKHSETKGLGLITILLIGSGLIVLNKGFGFIGNNYTITKKAAGSKLTAKN